MQEGGLLGSQAVANDYARRGINVYAMSQVRIQEIDEPTLSLKLIYLSPLPLLTQFDMTAWVKRGTVEAVGIIMDYTDAKYVPQSCYSRVRF